MNIKSLFKLFAITAMVAFFASCSSSDNNSIMPAPQVTSTPSSLNLVSGQLDSLNLTIVAPGKFKSITATADQGVISGLQDHITGTGTATGKATLKYKAPSTKGNFTITVTATDNEGKTGTRSIPVAVTDKPVITVPAGDVSGTWKKNQTYIVNTSINVPKDKALIIEGGATIIFGLATGGATAPELSVEGSLYSMGTKDAPILFTTPEVYRVKDSIFSGLWGGIQALPTAKEMVLQHTTVEYVGAPTSGTNKSLYDGGPYKDGDARFAVLFSNTTGKFVMQNCTIANSNDDGVRVTGGTILLTNNNFMLLGHTGGEALNIKSGTTGTVAYNMTYSAATNAYKWSNKSGTNANPQTNINVYNNTAVNCGWRRVKTGRGGSLNVEKGARGVVYNNLIVNCKFGLKIVKDADADNVESGYTQYYGSTDAIVKQFYTSDGIIKAGDKYTHGDIVGKAGEKNPMFVNFTVSKFTESPDDAGDTRPVDYLDKNADFHLKAGAPGLTAGKTDFTSIVTSITANGKTYESPAPSKFIGAFGTK